MQPRNCVEAHNTDNRNTKSNSAIHSYKEISRASNRPRDGRSDNKQERRRGGKKLTNVREREATSHHNSGSNEPPNFLRGDKCYYRR
jgi:hypothetical protein